MVKLFIALLILMSSIFGLTASAATAENGMEAEELTLALREAWPCPDTGGFVRVDPQRRLPEPLRDMFREEWPR